MKGNAELRFEDVVTRTSLIAAPILMLFSGLVLPQLHGPDGTELSVSASYPGRYYAYVLLGLAGSVALVPAVYAIARRTRLHRARRYTIPLPIRRANVADGRARRTGAGHLARRNGSDR